MIHIFVLGSATKYDDDDNPVEIKTPLIEEISEALLMLDDVQLYIIDKEYKYSLIANDSFPGKIIKEREVAINNGFIYPMNFDEFKKSNPEIFNNDDDTYIYLSYLGHANSYDLLDYVDDYNFKNRYCSCQKVKLTLTDLIKGYHNILNSKYTRYLSVPFDIFSGMSISDLNKNKLVRMSTQDRKEALFIVIMSIEIIINLLNAKCHLKATTIPTKPMNDWVYNMELPIYKAIISRYIVFPLENNDICPRLEFRKSANFRMKMTLKTIHLMSSLLNDFIPINTDLRNVKTWIELLENIEERWSYFFQ
jgi:hypothetical protein